MNCNYWQFESVKDSKGNKRIIANKARAGISSKIANTANRKNSNSSKYLSLYSSDRSIII